MKKLLLILLLGGLSLASLAQKVRPATTFYYHPRVFVGLGAYTPFYPYYGWGYPGFYGMYPYGYYARPSRLSMQIGEIRQDYHDRIKSAQSDKSLGRDERKEIVRKLKTERDQAIADLKRNYYKKPLDGSR